MRAEQSSGHAALWRMGVWITVIALILLIPLVAMQFSDEVVWTPFDFAVAATLLGGSALTYEIVASRKPGLAYRAGVAVAVATAFVLVWINGAVGILGDENDDANLIFMAVLGVGLLGALIARLKASGMSFALAATALAQLGTALIAFDAGWGEPRDAMLTAAFAPLWLVAAILFRASARNQNVAP